MAHPLAGKVVIITETSSGIGAATARTDAVAAKAALARSAGKLHALAAG